MLIEPNAKRRKTSGRRSTANLPLQLCEAHERRNECRLNPMPKQGKTSGRRSKANLPLQVCEARERRNEC